MKQLLAPNLAAMLGKTLMPREFIEFKVRNRTTGAAVYERLWSDIWDVNATVFDPDTSANQTYDWMGAASLIQIDSIPRVANLTSQEITIKMLSVGVDVDRLLRTYDAHQAPVKIWIGFLDLGTRRLVAAAEPKFYGFIDTCQMPTGTEDSDSFVTLHCKSHSQEMTRWNTDVRSDQSQRARSATDNFFASAASVSERTFFWGRAIAKVDAEKVTKLPKDAWR